MVFLKMLRLVIIIFVVSYFVGIFFFIFSDITREYGSTFCNKPPNFINNNGLDEIDSDTEKLIIMTYFAFTTLTTVGYGDYSP